MHIYIHIPFCTSKCPYCAFGSFSDKFSITKKYFDALKTEILHFTQTQKNLQISTLFIGGGTPSSVKSHFYAEIFEILNPYFTKNSEITSEANPNSANFSWLRDMKNFGLNRISFGVQSFNETKLKFLGRAHGVNEIYQSVENAKQAGFDNINIDLIYDTKYDDKKNLDFEIENVKNLNITHLSAYSLTLEENTPFYGKKSYKKGGERIAKFLFEKIENLGLKQYEISNFGKICKHNFAYWNGEDYLGFGAFAVGTKKNLRLNSPKHLEKYIQNPLHKDVEILSPEDKKSERIFLGMRSIIGVNAEILNDKELENAQILTQNGKLKFQNGKFYNKNFLLADEISLFIQS